jgi:hypothetical protein
MQCPLGVPDAHPLLYQIGVKDSLKNLGGGGRGAREAKGLGEKDIGKMPRFILLGAINPGLQEFHSIAIAFA